MDDAPKLVRSTQEPEVGGSKYEAPKLERLGAFREITLNGGDFLAADASNPYARYIGFA